MAYNSPFWDFVRTLDAQQQQPDHAAPRAAPAAEPFQTFAGAFPFGGPGLNIPFSFGPQEHPHHGRGRRSRGCPRGECPAMDPDASEAPRATSAGPEHSDSEPHGPHFGRHPHGPHGHGPHGHGHGHRGGRRGHGGRHGPGGRFGPPPPFAAADAAPFDLSALLGTLASHPLAAVLRSVVEEATRAGAGAETSTDPNTAPAAAESAEKDTAAEETNTFSPAVDIFSTPTAYVLHVALPGARKEDVGVNWDAEKGELNIAGVVYRAGDEAFLKALTKAERRVGMFERSVGLPLKGEEGVEVDAENIAAKLEDGVLVVTVGKVEVEEKFVEVTRVEIE